MAEALIVGPLGLAIGRAPERVVVQLGPLGIALTVAEARNHIAQLQAVTTQVAAAIVIATPDQLPPLNLNGHG